MNELRLYAPAIVWATGSLVSSVVVSRLWIGVVMLLTVWAVLLHVGELFRRADKKRRQRNA